jgi:hypothetical protein
MVLCYFLPLANEPLVLWTFGPKTSGPKDSGQKATRSMPSAPLERPQKVFRDRGVRLPANQQNWSRLRFAISTFSTAAATCSSWPTAVVFRRLRYGSGAGSPLTCKLLHDDPIKVSSINSRTPSGSSSHRPHEHRSLLSSPSIPWF